MKRNQRISPHKTGLFCNYCWWIICICFLFIYDPVQFKEFWYGYGHQHTEVEPKRSRQGNYENKKVNRELKNTTNLLKLKRFSHLCLRLYIMMVSDKRWWVLSYLSTLQIKKKSINEKTWTICVHDLYISNKKNIRSFNCLIIQHIAWANWRPEITVV